MRKIKEKFKYITGLIRRKPGLAASRLVLFVAFCGFVFSCGLYWTSQHGGGMGAEPRPLSRAAQAEGMRMSAEVLSAVLSKEAEKIRPDGLKADHVDMAAALKRVYPDLADSGYFVLWRGTVDVCSPLTPDTAGIDFGDRRDAAGGHFVRELERIAREGGGFHSFDLVYDVPLGSAGAGHEKFASEFIAYSTPVHGTDLHLTIWRPVEQGQLSLRAELEEDASNWSLFGLCMASLSFLGVSVLMRGVRD